MSENYRYILEVYRQFLAESEAYNTLVNTVRDIDDQGILPDKFKHPFEPTKSNILKFVNIANEQNDIKKAIDEYSQIVNPLLLFQYAWFQDIDNESEKKFWDRVKEFIYPYILIKKYDDNPKLDFAEEILHADLLNFYNAYYRKNNNTDNIKDFIDNFTSMLSKYKFGKYLYLDGNIINNKSCNLNISNSDYKRLKDDIISKKNVTLYNLFNKQFIITDTSSNIEKYEDMLYRYKKCKEIKARRKRNKQKYNDYETAKDYMDIDPYYTKKQLNIGRDRRQSENIIHNVERCIFPGRFSNFNRKRKSVKISISYD
jgi:hypothetical protein